MSWFNTISHVQKATAKETLGATEPQLGDHNPARHESIAQHAQAVEMAVRLIDSGTLGEGPFTVSLSGHANPSHADVYGWANDQISVNVIRETILPE